MDKDSQLIFEAYLEENVVRSTALSLLCALGVNLTACKTLEKVPTDRGPGMILVDPNFWSILGDLFGDVELTPEQLQELHRDLERHIDHSNEAHHDPKYWRSWTIEWKNKHSI